MIRKPSGLLLLGRPVGHSLSPVMQNAALRDAGIDIEYTARETHEEELPEVVAMIREHGVAGNVTIPHKVQMAALCDVLTPMAQRVGAVNTFWMNNGTLYGDNTDVGGFDTAVRAVIGTPKRGLRATILGAGGAAFAVAAAIEQWDSAQVTVWNRSPERLDSFVQRFGTARREMIIARAVEDADLVINTTPNGLIDDTHPVDLALLAPHAAVFDLVYKVGETAWVRAARTAGHPAADGLGMLIEQGALAFERWFGVAPNRQVMWRSITGSQTTAITPTLTTPH
jgi:shikimate dehydrogenase